MIELSEQCFEDAIDGVALFVSDLAKDGRKETKG